MKLGTETGSFINHLQARSTIGQPTPEVGMGATMLLWTDRVAGTITKVTELGGSKRWTYEIEVKRDVSNVVSGSGHDGSAKYEYQSAPWATPHHFRCERDGGRWREVRENDKGNLVLVSSGGRGLRIGEREEYRDPSF